MSGDGTFAGQIAAQRPHNRQYDKRSAYSASVGIVFSFAWRISTFRPRAT
jgi:hypothetical protein